MNRTATIFSLSALVLLTAAACGKDSEGSNKAAKAAAAKGPTAAGKTPARKSAATSAAKPLETYTNTELGFAVDAPRTPKRARASAPSEAGQLELQTFDFAPPGTQGGLIVSVNPMPADREIDLDGARDGAIRSMAGKLVSTEDVELDGHPGRVFRFRVPAQKIAGYVRFYERDHMLYQVLLAHLEGDEKLRQTGEQFVDSFRFVARK